MRLHDQQSSLERLLRLLSPWHQMTANAVTGLVWIAAVGCSVLALVLWWLSRDQWVSVAAIAGFLWFTLIAGAVCELLFGQYEPMDDGEDLRRRK